MKWYLLIGSTLVIVVGVVVVVFWPSTPQKAQAPGGTVGLPNSGSIGGTTQVGGTASTSASPGGITLAGQDGSSVTVTDFIHNGETAVDVANPGSYILAGSAGYCLPDGTCPAGASTTDFTLTYNGKTQFFNLVLLKEPLGAVRKEAEQFFEDRLGIGDGQACLLNYFVSTPYWVNASFTGKNLGFSFCAGATNLPR